MNSSSYWRKREEKWIQQQMKEDAKQSKVIAEKYQKALDQIQKEVDANWERFAGKEGVSLSEAKKLAYEMDVKSFARKAKEYVKNKDFSKSANDELRLYNVTMRTNRLELLKSQLGLELTALSDELDKYTVETLGKVGTAEAKRQAGILGETIFSDYEKFVDTVANASFQGASFSERIWGNLGALKADLDRLLIRSITQGRNPRELARELRNLFESSKFEAERLMRTETARVQIAVQMKSYLENEIDEYLFIAEPDACKKCSAAARKSEKEPFSVAKSEIGLNTPPLHPNCRCSTVPFVEELSVAEAREQLDKAKKAEPNITKDMKSIADFLGTTLDGLDFRLKTLESLSRKLSNEPGANMRDVVRYTSISDNENMTKDFNKFVEELKNRGYNVSAVKNYWNNSSNPYNGINTNFFSPKGYEFEIQFHTRESFELKNGKLHELYEKARVIDDKTSKEYIALQDEMFDLSEALIRPKNIESVKDVK